MNRDEWLQSLAGVLGIAAPSPADVDALLELAGIAAHASERQSAPLSCWLLGQAGVAPGAALDLVRGLAGGVA